MTKYDIYKKLRDAKGLSDQQVSAGSGVSRSTFSDWKNGRCEPKEPKLQALATFFNVPLRTFFGEIKEGETSPDNKTAVIAEIISQNDELRLLMDASMRMPKEMLVAFRKFVEALSKEKDNEGA